MFEKPTVDEIDMVWDDALLDIALPPDPLPDDQLPGKLIMRDGMPIRLVPEDAVPSWVSSWDSGWPPDSVPVALWPAAQLRAAFAGAPGAELARVVTEAMDPQADLLAELPDDALGDLVTACGRLQSWAAGVQARVVGERAARETHPLAHSSLVAQVTTELVVTGEEASEVVVRAESGTDHPTVIHALETGRIDIKKAHTLLRSATQLTLAERAEAIAKYLPQAPRRTWRWLQTKMLAFAKDRHGSAKAAQAAAQHRSVHLDRAENDMGWLSAYLPAADAAAVWGVVDDMAHQLRHVTGEERTLVQLRADSLTGIVTGRLLPADRFTDTCTCTNPQDHTDAHDRTDTHGRTKPGSSGDMAAVAGEDAQNGAGTDGDVAGPVCTCGGRPPVVQEIVQVVRVTPTRPVVRVTVPVSALLGLDDAPGELEGFGPVTADLAAQIATDATWQRLVTDPVTGVLTDYSTTTYRPGKVLRQAVVARDKTCMFLQCERPADWDDLDHIVPFDHDLDPSSLRPGTRGQTRAENLHPLCRRHHLLKTHAGWGVVRDPATGVTTWTTPAGRNHVRPPTVLDTHVEIDEVDPESSYDLTLRALTGRRLPRAYQSTEPRTVPGDPGNPGDPGDPGTSGTTTDPNGPTGPNGPADPDPPF
ncbi:HNH endonuclease [Promicromonospora sp. Populi]|uniref:HNH endonuclease n=1 Tax=Promicromonospora sp. Populi TaxID=3239420 RepID=UPI0034E2D6F4